VEDFSGSHSGIPHHVLNLSQSLSLAHETISQLQMEVSQLKGQLEELRNEVSLLKERSSSEVPTKVPSARKKLPSDLSVRTCTV
jgi:phage shock protein A